MEGPESDGAGHTERHGRKAPEVDADRVRIEFGPDVLRELKRLEQAVEGKKEFDDDMRRILQRLASGKPVPLHDALTWLTMLGQSTAEYMQDSGDREAGSALGLLTAHLMGQSPDAKPLTVFVEPRVKARLA